MNGKSFLRHLGSFLSHFGTIVCHFGPVHSYSGPFSSKAFESFGINCELFLNDLTGLETFCHVRQVSSYFRQILRHLRRFISNSGQISVIYDDF